MGEKKMAFQKKRGEITTEREGRGIEQSVERER